MRESESKSQGADKMNQKVDCRDKVITYQMSSDR